MATFKRSYPIVSDDARGALDGLKILNVEFELSRARLDQVRLRGNGAVLGQVDPAQPGAARTRGAPRAPGPPPAGGAGGAGNAGASRGAGADSDADADAAPAELPVNVVQLLFEEEVGTVGLDSLSVDVVSSDEPIAVTRLFAQTADGTQVTLDVGEYCPQQDDTPPEVEVSEGWDDYFGPAEYVTAMLEAILLEPEHPWFNARCYFFLLDYRTHPQLVTLHSDSVIPSESYGYLIKELQDQVINRIKLVNLGLDPYVSLSASAKGVISPGLAHLQEGLIRACYVEDLELFEAGIRAFANGDLRFQLPNGMWTTQPSSANFFLFGELAIATGRIFEAQGDQAMTTYWTQVASASVCAQRLFATSYPSSGPTFFSSYDPCSFTEPGKDADQRAPTIAQPTLDLVEQEAAEIAATYLADEAGP